MTTFRTVFGALLVAVLLALGLSDLAGAQATGSIEIHKRVCPAGTTGNIFDECHGNPPEQPVSFSLDGGPEQFVDAQGDVTFTGLAGGTYEISEVEGIPLDFVTLQVYCSVQTDDPEVFAVTTDGPNFSVELGEGEDIVCDVYNVAENLSGLTPTPVVTATPGITLPNTGSGVDRNSTSMLPFGLAIIAVLLGTVGLLTSRTRASFRG